MYNAIKTHTIETILFKNNVLGPIKTVVVVETLFRRSVYVNYIERRTVQKFVSLQGSRSVDLGGHVPARPLECGHSSATDALDFVNVANKFNITSRLPMSGTDDVRPKQSFHPLGFLHYRVFAFAFT